MAYTLAKNVQCVTAVGTWHSQLFALSFPLSQPTQLETTSVFAGASRCEHRSHFIYLSIYLHATVCCGACHAVFRTFACP